MLELDWNRKVRIKLRDWAVDASRKLAFKCKDLRLERHIYGKNQMCTATLEGSEI